MAVDHNGPARALQRELDLARVEELADLDAERKSVLASRAVAAAIQEHRAAEERKVRIRQERRALEERYGGGWTRDPDLERAEARTESTKRLKRAAYTDVLYAPPPQVASPSVILGGPTLHARDPHLWDIEVYTSAEIGPSFAGFKLPVYVSMRDRMKAELAERTGVDESEISTSATCMNTINNNVKAVIAGESTGAVHGMMFQLRATVPTQQALTALLNAPGIASKTVRWAGALQKIGPEDETRYQLAMTPHIIQESTTSGGTGRRIVIEHNGQPPYVTSSTTSPAATWVDTTNLLDVFDPALIRPDDRTYTKPPAPALFEIMLISSAAGWEAHFVRQA